MRTNIDIDEGLVRKARKLTRLKSKQWIKPWSYWSGRRAAKAYSGTTVVAYGKGLPRPCGETESDLSGQFRLD
ncbi:MAG: type II toxin-antitoxin system VapB family antitoxin [Candidatus Acidiferrales bacterium]